MIKEKKYSEVRFTPEVLVESRDVMFSFINLDEKEYDAYTYSVEFSDESWHHDDENEFFSDCRRNPLYFTYRREIDEYELRVFFSFNSSLVSVQGPNRGEIEQIFEVFERLASDCKIEPPPKKIIEPIIFIGHGRSNQWRDLKDHLQDQHGYEVEAYEIGARAGHGIRDILEEMLTRSTFAIIVLTAEDRDESGGYRARQNVIHELGLFQGHLGFSKAIVLLEEGTEEFSNIHGIHQIRYSKDKINETFGDVLATLRREF